MPIVTDDSHILSLKNIELIKPPRNTLTVTNIDKKVELSELKKYFFELLKINPGLKLTLKSPKKEVMIFFADLIKDKNCHLKNIGLSTIDSRLLHYLSEALIHPNCSLMSIFFHSQNVNFNDHHRLFITEGINKNKTLTSLCISDAQKEYFVDKVNEWLSNEFGNNCQVNIDKQARLKNKQPNREQSSTGVPSERMSANVHSSPHFSDLSIIGAQFYSDSTHNAYNSECTSQPGMSIPKPSLVTSPVQSRYLKDLQDRNYQLESAYENLHSQYVRLAEEKQYCINQIDELKRQNEYKQQCHMDLYANYQALQESVALRDWVPARVSSYQSTLLPQCGSVTSEVSYSSSATQPIQAKRKPFSPQKSPQQPAKHFKPLVAVRTECVPSQITSTPISAQSLSRPVSSNTTLLAAMPMSNLNMEASQSYYHAMSAGSSAAMASVAPMAVQHHGCYVQNAVSSPGWPSHLSTSMPVTDMTSSVAQSLWHGAPFINNGVNFYPSQVPYTQQATVSSSLLLSLQSTPTREGVATCSTPPTSRSAPMCRNTGNGASLGRVSNIATPSKQSSLPSSSAYSLMPPSGSTPCGLNSITPTSAIGSVVSRVNSPSLANTGSPIANPDFG